MVNIRLRGWLEGFISYVKLLEGKIGGLIMVNNGE